MNHPSGIDRKTLDHLFENTLSGTEEVFQQIIEIFLMESPRLLSEVSQANDSGDPAGMAHAAHKLKSNGLSLGALLFADCCHEIEKMGKEGSLEGAFVVIRRAEDELRLCCNYLEEELKKRRSVRAS